MRKTLGVAALMLAFCCPALAGEIPNPPLDGEMHTPPASGTQATTVQEPTAEGNIPNDVTDSLTQTALELLALLPTLL